MGNNDEPPEGTEWDGSGVAIGEAYVYRTGNDDFNTKEGWGVGSSGTIDALNPGQSNSAQVDYWISVVPVQGVIEGNGEQVLTLTFSSHELEIGSYFDTLTIMVDWKHENIIHQMKLILFHQLANGKILILYNQHYTKYPILVIRICNNPVSRSTTEFRQTSLNSLSNRIP